MPSKPKQLQRSGPVNGEFASRLIFARKQAGFQTQQALADALSIDRRVVSRWESGHTLPTTDKLLELADRLKISLDWLLRGLGSMPAPRPSGS